MTDDGLEPDMSKIPDNLQKHISIVSYLEDLDMYEVTLTPEGQMKVLEERLRLLENNN
jgi:hypothetical protein